MRAAEAHAADAAMTVAAKSAEAAAAAAEEATAEAAARAEEATAEAEARAEAYMHEELNALEEMLDKIYSAAPKVKTAAQGIAKAAKAVPKAASEGAAAPPKPGAAAKGGKAAVSEEANELAKLQKSLIEVKKDLKAREAEVPVARTANLLLLCCCSAAALPLFCCCLCSTAAAPDCRCSSSVSRAGANAQIVAQGRASGRKGQGAGRLAAPAEQRRLRPRRALWRRGERRGAAADRL